MAKYDVTSVRGKIKKCERKLIKIYRSVDERTRENRRVFKS